jgi:uncharacterized membrane protein
MTAEILVLRLVHILGGIFWVGIGLFNTFFLMPALGKVGPAAGPVIAALQQRRLFTVLPTIAVLTILSGVRLLWIMSGGGNPAYFSSGVGRTFSMSGGAAIVAFLVGMFVARPAALRAAAIARTLATTEDPAAKGALSAQMESARRRAAVTNTAAVALLVLSAAGMAVARYVG